MRKLPAARPPAMVDSDQPNSVVRRGTMDHHPARWFLGGFGTVQLAAGHGGIDAQGAFFEHGRLDPPVTTGLCEALAAQ